MKSKNIKLMLLLLLNTVVLCSVYFALASIEFPIHYIYLAIGFGFGLIFVIYNRGFVGKDITPSMLPDTMTKEEKQAFIDDCKKRLNASRWMLTIIIPLIFAFALDMIYLFLFPALESIFL